MRPANNPATSPEYYSLVGNAVATFQEAAATIVDQIIAAQPSRPKLNMLLEALRKLHTRYFRPMIGFPRRGLRGTMKP